MGVLVISVVSTGFRAPTKRICLASVAAQEGVQGGFEHIYVEASEQTPPKPASQNLYEAINALPPENIVVWLDGDDLLYSTGSLAWVEKLYEPLLYASEALVTYGQFICLDGQPGFAAPYPPGANVRTHPWLATHLKTFQAGLFQQLKAEDLQLDGQWVHRAVDLAIMLPLLEMAGPDRVRFNPEVLCVYNSDASFEAGARQSDLDEERIYVARVRAKKSYERLP